MHKIHPSKEIQEAAGSISVEIEALEYVRKDLWCLPYEHRRKPEVLKLIKAHHEYAVCQIPPLIDNNVADQFKAQRSSQMGGERRQAHQL